MRKRTLDVGPGRKSRRVPLNLDPFRSQEKDSRRGRGGKDVQPFCKDERWARGDHMKVTSIGGSHRRMKKVKLLRSQGAGRRDGTCADLEDLISA